MTDANNPLAGLEEWEDFLKVRYPEPQPAAKPFKATDPAKKKEQIRHDGHPRWFILAGLIHDLGKILCLYGEPQWAVVGDTFPVACAWSDRIVFHEFFVENPDRDEPRYQRRLGIYEENCGLENVS